MSIERHTSELANSDAGRSPLACLKRGLASIRRPGIDFTGVELDVEMLIRAAEGLDQANGPETVSPSIADKALVEIVLGESGTSAKRVTADDLFTRFDLQSGGLFTSAITIAIGLFGLWSNEAFTSEPQALRYRWRSATLAFIRIYASGLHDPTRRSEYIRKLYPVFPPFYADCEAIDELGFAIDLIEFFTRGTNADIVSSCLLDNYTRQARARMLAGAPDLVGAHEPPADDVSPRSAATELADELQLPTVIRHPVPLLNQLRAISLTQCTLLPFWWNGNWRLYLILPYLGAVLRFDVDQAKLVGSLEAIHELLPDPRMYQGWLASQRIWNMRERSQKNFDKAKLHLCAIYEALFQKSTALGGWQRTLAQEIDRWGGLYIVPDENGPWLPWHLLHDGERYLLQRWSMSYFPSIDVMYSVLSYRAGHTSGSPDATVDNLQNNPCLVAEGTTERSRDESWQVRSVLQQYGYAVSDAEASFGLVHLAGHGTSSESGALFRVQLGEQWVSTTDLLRGALRSRAIVVNACDVCTLSTYLTDDVPLLLALFASGNRNVVGSQWPVLDSCAKEFAGQFYRYFVAGCTMADAWRQTMSNCLQSADDLLRFGGYQVFGALDDHDPQLLKSIADNLVAHGSARLEQGFHREGIESLMDAYPRYLRARCWRETAETCEGVMIAIGQLHDEIEIALAYGFQALSAWACDGLRGNELLRKLSGYLTDLDLEESHWRFWTAIAPNLQLAFAAKGLSLSDAHLDPPSGSCWDAENQRIICD